MQSITFFTNLSSRKNKILQYLSLTETAFKYYDANKLLLITGCFETKTALYEKGENVFCQGKILS